MNIKNDIPSIFSLTFGELKQFLIDKQYEPYRAKQIYHFLYQKGIDKFSDIPNIPKTLIETLNNSFIVNTIQIVKQQVSHNSETYKYLLNLNDNHKIESVVIIDRPRNTLCISSQVGCPLGCLFCLTGQMGIKRNLLAGEMVAQFIHAKKIHGSIDNVVFMGMGEPLLNYNNVMKSIKIINSDEGLNFGAKRITISTAGITKGMRKLAHETINIRLAVSVNSLNQLDRAKIMPFSKRNNSLKELISTCKYYQKKTDKRITLEYTMIKDVNMTKQDAKELIKLSKELQFNLNLIPFNLIPNCDYRVPSNSDIFFFTQLFKYSKIEVVQRKRKGRDISAACGQLITETTNE
jgi:23S rRNA (adenine2503-C2)-methyltransferase